MVEQSGVAALRPEGDVAAGVAVAQGFSQNGGQQQVAHATVRMNDEDVSG